MQARKTGDVHTDGGHPLPAAEFVQVRGGLTGLCLSVSLDDLTWIERRCPNSPGHRPQPGQYRHCRINHADDRDFQRRPTTKVARSGQRQHQRQAQSSARTQKCAVNSLEGVCARSDQTTRLPRQKARIRLRLLRITPVSRLPGILSIKGVGLALLRVCPHPYGTEPRLLQLGQRLPRLSSAVTSATLGCSRRIVHGCCNLVTLNVYRPAPSILCACKWA